MKQITKKDFLDNFNFRYACKVCDNNRKISDEDIRFILDIGRRSPSSFGMEPWKFLVITNQDLRQKLKPYCWDQDQITSCSHLVVVLASIENVKISSGIPKQKFIRRGLPQDKLSFYLEKYASHLKETLKNDKNIYCWTARQTYLSVANMLNAGAFFGIDSCPIEGFEKDKVEQILNIDTTQYQLSVMIAFGYRKNQQSIQLRDDFDKIVQFID